VNGITAKLDHLVVAAHSLDQGASYIQTCLGVTPIGGGKHRAVGTHNRVLNLGHGQYLEVIAVDPDATPPAFPRWFHLDDPGLQEGLKIRPRLIAWVARTRDIDRLATAYRQVRVEIRPMQRDALRWRFAFTTDGALPGDGLIPHLIQWESPNHPTEKMPESGCRLLGLEGVYANQGIIQETIAAMGLAEAIGLHRVPGRRSPGLIARIETPSGEVILD
jgi:hypothetical protein